ncbi:MAG: PRC-barrel domain containing protein [Paucimonas sp.]|nr:PRC-barrel domain containing protein [Paucimonas sp.]
MLHSIKDLEGFSIAATDGDIGTIEDVYFDDRRWAIRYFVVDTGGWLSGRKVLVSPLSATGIEWENNRLHVALTRTQVEQSPDIENDQPISRDHETRFNEHYGYKDYWNFASLWGEAIVSPLLDSASTTDPDTDPLRAEYRDDNVRGTTPENTLCSANDLHGYSIRAIGETVGHVEEFLFDDQDWSIQLMVTDTRDWWPGKKVLISPERIAEIAADSKEVIVNITREEVEDSPEYDPLISIPPEMRGGLYRQPGWP